MLFFVEYSEKLLLFMLLFNTEFNWKTASSKTEKLANIIIKLFASINTVKKNTTVKKTSRIFIKLLLWKFIMEINTRIFNAAKRITDVAAADKRLKLKILLEKSPNMPNDRIFKNNAAIMETADTAIPNIFNPSFLESPKNTSIRPPVTMLRLVKNG